MTGRPVQGAAIFRESEKLASVCLDFTLIVTTSPLWRLAERRCRKGLFTNDVMLQRGGGPTSWG